MFISIQLIKKENNNINDLTFQKPKQWEFFQIPKEGTVFGKIIIPSLSIETDIIYGDSQKLIDTYNVCCSSSGNLFGEGSSILLGGHNTKILKNIFDIPIGTQIEIITLYGEYKYEVIETYVTKVNKDKNELIDIKTNKNILELKGDKEILQIYTCYPKKAEKDTPYRYVIKAKES